MRSYYTYCKYTLSVEHTPSMKLPYRCDSRFSTIHSKLLPSQRRLHFLLNKLTWIVYAHISELTLSRAKADSHLHDIT